MTTEIKIKKNNQQRHIRVHTETKEAEKGKTEERDRNINGENKCFVCTTLASFLML